jgi:hypothetical protein
LFYKDLTIELGTIDMKFIIIILLTLYPFTIFSADVRFSNGILLIDEVDLPDTSKKVSNAKFRLAEDGRWDLLAYTEGGQAGDSIGFGFVDGPCLAGYCSSPDLVITPEKITLSNWSSTIDPDTKILSNADSSISKNDGSYWNATIKLFDLDSFFKLPDVIGDCLGCADSPVAYITIQYKGRFKQIRFEPGNGPAELFNSLLEIYIEQAKNLGLAMQELGFVKPTE